MTSISSRVRRIKALAVAGAILMCLSALSAQPVGAAVHPGGASSVEASHDAISINVHVQRLPDTDEVDMTKGPLPAIRNAKVEVVEAGLVGSTGPKGEATFSIVPGDYTLRVSAPGIAYTSSFQVSVVPFGQTDFELHFDAQRDFKADYTFKTAQKNRILAPLQAPPKSSSETSASELNAASSSENIVSPMSVPIEPVIPATIRVYSVSGSRTYVYAIEDYVKKVLAGEVGLGFYMSTGNSYLTSAQELTFFSAKAIAVRTYGAFHARNYRCATIGQPEKVNDTTDCQVVNHTFPTTGTDNINQAVNGTAYKVLVYVRDLQNGLYDEVDAVFFASSSGQTRSAASMYPLFNPTAYLQSETDTYDPDASTWICNTKPQVGYCDSAKPDYRLGSNYAGHGVGLSQDGSAGWAKNGYSYTWIVTHYYRGTSIYVASTY